MPAILVIDDDATIRRPLRIALERAGYVVHEAANGREGVTTFREHRFDIVLTDLFMPEKDGLEVILELRALQAGVKIIAMSGGASTVALDLLRDAQLLGALRVIAKPFKTEQLLTMLREVLAA